MPDQANDKRPHFFPKGTSKSRPFTAHSQGGGGSKAAPDLPRAQHGTALRAQLQDLKPLAENAAAAQKEHGIESGLGLQIQFISQPEVELAFESLGNETKKIELLSIRREGDYTYANVFVPDGGLEHFEKYVVEYLEEKKNKNGDALDHKALLNTISAVRAAEIRELWTDDLALPEDPAEQFWWEVWLPVRGKRGQVVADFRKLVS